MEHIESTATGAEELINQTVDEADSADNIIGELEDSKEMLEASEAATVQQYIDGIRPQIEGAMVTDLDPGVGGLYDGSPQVKIAEDMLVIDQSVDATIARLEEVREHENYHAENNHLEPMDVVHDTRTDAFAVIGGQEFTETELIEGLTVMQTGNTFVSDEYRDHERTLEAAMAASGQSVEDIEEAVNHAKDITLIDDRSRVAATTLAA